MQSYISFEKRGHIDITLKGSEGEACSENIIQYLHNINADYGYL